MNMFAGETFKFCERILHAQTMQQQQERSNYANGHS